MKNLAWLTGGAVGFAILVLLGQINAHDDIVMHRACAPTTQDEIALSRMGADGKVVCEIHPRSIYRASTQNYSME
jgi:hypothetical protein